MTKALHGFVSGRVQAVGYRQSCRRVARSHDLVGWVRNRIDGRVELHAQGEPEALDALVDWLWDGPPGALVTGVETDVVAPDHTITDFFIQPNEKT